MGGRPTHIVYLVHKQTKIYTKVGVGWDHLGNGKVSIALDPGSVLDWRINEDFYINVSRRTEVEHDVNNTPF